MALSQENVHYTLNSGPDVTSKSNRVHAQIQELLSGGGGGGGRGTTVRKQSGQCFLVINLFYSLQSGSNGFITEGRRGSNFFQGVGVSKETHITCDFPGGGGGGVRTPNPLWIRMCGRLTPLFAYRIMVYQNLNKTEKYHPTTTKRKKAISCWSRWQVRIQRGVRGSRPPWKITSHMGFYRVKAIGLPRKKLDPPAKMLDPLWNLEK